MTTCTSARSERCWRSAPGSACLVAACSSSSNSCDRRQHRVDGGSFPTSISAANGTVRIKARPHAIVSLSPTATEMLYAIGAGSQVKAVDKYSDYPKKAPRTTLDELQPNVEAIVSYRPDLVVVPGDSTASPGRLKRVRHSGAVASPGHDARRRLRASTTSWARPRATWPGGGRGRPREGADRRRSCDARRRPTRGQTYYYELDQTYFSVTSSTFIGKVLGLLGLRNIADSAPSAASSGGYPQLSAEFIVQSNPDWVFLADTICCGQSAHTVAARPGGRR